MCIVIKGTMSTIKHEKKIFTRNSLEIVNMLKIIKLQLNDIFLGSYN